MGLERAEVEVYSGYTYAQEPRALIWHGRRYGVACVEQRWRTPEGPAFQVATESGDRFEIHYRMRQSEWRVRRLTGVEGEETEADDGVVAGGASRSDRLARSTICPPRLAAGFAAEEDHGRGGPGSG
jgi:hypothetical protein